MELEDHVVVVVRLDVVLWMCFGCCADFNASASASCPRRINRMGCRYSVAVPKGHDVELVSSMSYGLRNAWCCCVA